MELLKPLMFETIKSSTVKNPMFKRNLLKEYLQIIILDYLYSHDPYQNLLFYGGSCLKHCYGLPRLSEDLDFIDTEKQVDLTLLEENLTSYFAKQTDLRLKVSIQKFRLTLKFPILKELGISNPSETDDLFLKIEVYQDISYCKKFESIMVPLFKYNKSILVRTFDLPTLMATKIRAILYRKWEKTNSQGKTTILFKGRDFFDLMWYLEKGIQPNMDCIEDFETKEQLFLHLLSLITKLDPMSIQLDLESFMENQDFVKKLSTSLESILTNLLKQN